MFLALALTATLHAAPRTFVITDDTKSWAGFRIEDTLETIDADTKNVSGSITADPDDLASSSVTIVVDLKSLDSGLRMRDDDMRDTYLQTKKFPTATFRSTSVTGPTSLSVGQSAELKVAGDFTLHGVTRRIVVPVRVTLDSPNRAHCTSHFTIRMTDYDVTVPKKLMLSVANDVDVKFDLWASAR